MYYFSINNSEVGGFMWLVKKRNGEFADKKKDSVAPYEMRLSEF